MPKAISNLLVNEWSSYSYPHVLAELHGKFAKFLSALPAVLDWTTIGIPSLEVDAIESVDTKGASSETVDSHAADFHITDYQITDSPIADLERRKSQTATCNTRLDHPYRKKYSRLFLPSFPPFFCPKKIGVLQRQC